VKGETGEGFPEGLLVVISPGGMRVRESHRRARVMSERTVGYFIVSSRIANKGAG